MTSQLETLVWDSMIGAHARFSVGNASARRYLPGFSPIVAFVHPEKADLRALEAHCIPGEHLYSNCSVKTTPPGWAVEAEKAMLSLVWEGGVPSPEAGIVTLGPQMAAQAFDLASLTHPGPFGLRTIELGEFVGLFEEDRLVSMAGERFYSPPFREISGVCTHPAFQGKGRARRLVSALIRRQLLRGEIPMLHVLAENTVAKALYEAMGFRARRETVVSVLSWTPA